jgi:hypothetical protein
VQLITCTARHHVINTGFSIIIIIIIIIWFIVGALQSFTHLYWLLFEQ